VIFNKQKEKIMQAANLTEAIIIALQTFDQPSHYKDIASLIVKNNVFNFPKQQPEDSVASCLRKEISQKGADARFIRVSQGVYGLNNVLFPSFNISKPIPNPSSDTLPSSFIKFGGSDERKEAFVQRKTDDLFKEPDFLSKLVNAANRVITGIKQEFWW
jgi:HB1, ASXL, restriction endonuclease HTH domain